MLSGVRVGVWANREGFSLLIHTKKVCSAQPSSSNSWWNFQETMGHTQRASESSEHDSPDYRVLHMPNLESFQIADGWQWDQSDRHWRGQTHSVITYYTNNDNNSNIISHVYRSNWHACIILPNSFTALWKSIIICTTRLNTLKPGIRKKWDGLSIVIE